jgi:hypothetical protein
MTCSNEQSISRPAGAARWVVVVILAILAGGLLVEASRAVGDGGGQAFSAAPSVVAVTGQITRDSYGIYLVDTNNQTICIYQYVASQRMLRLLAARTFAFDSQLDDYNTEPSPREIRELVRSHPRLTDPAPLPETPPVDEPTDEPVDESETTPNE